MNKIIGFIGAGNMGSAIIEGLINANIIPATNIYAVSHDLQRLASLTKKLGIKQANTIKDITKLSDVLVVAVKPKDVANVLAEASQYLKQEVIIISIAAGITLESLEKAVGTKQKIIRVMPNTPSLVGEGMSSITPNQLVTEEDLALAITLFNGLGKTEIVPEELIHAVVGVSGSSPAYIFILIEAMADAAVLGGMPRKQAYTFAAQAVMGSAKMVLDTGLHPADLKDMVCSPAGTTIDAVAILEEKGFRSAIIEAIKHCMTKSIKMSKD